MTTICDALFPQADDPLSGKPFHGEQAILALRFEYWKYIKPLQEVLGGWLTRSGAQIALALHAEAKGAGRRVNYSASKAWYPAHKTPNPDFTYHGIVETGVNPLAQAGWIEDWRQERGVRGWQSCMRATEGLVEAVDDVIRYAGRPKALQPDDVLILRDAKGRAITMPKTQRIERRRAQLRRCNAFLASADVQGGSACMVRISNVEPERVCRAYAQGGAWQNMRTEVRRALRIEDEDVCELDFRSMHPAILYLALDLPVPEDPYWIGDGWDRDFCKIALNTMINAPNWKSAVGAVANSELMDLYADAGSGEAVKIAMEAIRLLKAANAPIGEFLYSGAGAGLMFREAEVAMDVVSRLADRGVVVLPVHDSFLVKVSQIEVLREAMETALDRAGLGEVRIRTKHLPGWKTASKRKVVRNMGFR